MATVSTFNIALIASTGRFVSSIAKAERQWNSFSRSVQRQAKTLPKSIREAVPASLALGRNVAKWAAVATAALGGLSAAGVKLAADFEQSQIAFETMLGDAERARRFLRELEVYARRTPFGFVGLQQSARQLLAYGFTADRVLEMITPIGDTVAAMGGGQQMLEAIIRALGQIQAKGKLASQEFLQLTEQGVAAWQMLAEFLGVSVPEAMDLASRGAISSAVAVEAVLQGMTSRFAGAMTRQATTMAGRWEQIKDSVTTIVRAWGQDVVRITGLAAAMGVLADAIERVADAVSLHGFFGALERAFPPWVQPVIVGIAGAIVGGLVPAIVAWLIPALKKLGVSLWATLRPLTPWMAVGAAVALTAYVLARNWGNLAEVGQRVWTVLGGVAMYGASLVVRGSALIYQALSWIVPALRGTAESVMAYANSLRDSALQAIQSATASARVAQQAAESAFTAEQAAQAQETLAAGLEAAQKAAEGGIQSFDEVHQVQESLLDSFELPEFQPLDVALPNLDATASMADGLAALEGVITSIGEAASRAWDRLTQSMEPVRQAVEWLRREWPGLDVVLENTAAIITFTLVPALTLAAARATWSATQQVAAWVTTAGRAVWSIGVQVAEMAVLAARWIWLGAVAVAHGVRVAAGWVIAMGPIAWAIAAAAALAAAIWHYWEDIVAAVASAQAWFAANVAPVWDRIVTAVLMAWNTLATVAGDVWAAILLAIQTVMDWVSTVPAIWDQVAGAIGEAWTVLAALASDIWSGIHAAVQAVVDWTSQTLGSVWQAAADAVVAAWERLGAAAQATWSAIQDAVSAVWNWASETAGTVWQGVTAVITAAWDALHSAATMVWGGIRSAIEAVWNWASATVAAVWDAVTGAILAAWDAVSSAATTTWQAVRGAIEAVWSWAEQTAGAVWGAVAGAIEGAWTALSGAASATWGAIRGTIEAVWNWASEQASAVWGTVSTAITSAWATVEDAAGRVWDGVKATVNAVWTWASEQAGAVWSGVSGAITAVWDGLSAAATVTWDAIRAAISAVWSWADTQASAVWTAVRSAIEAAWTALAETATTVWQSVRTAIEDVWTWAESTAASVWHAVASAVTSAWDGLVASAKSTWTSIRAAVVDGWETAKNTVSDIVAAIEKAIDNMAKSVERVVTDLRNKVIGWWDDMKKSVTETAGNLVSGVTGFFQRLYDTLVGHSIVPDLVEDVTSWFQRMMSALTGQFGQGYNTILAQSQTFGGDMMGWAGTLSTGLQAAFTQAFSGILSGTMSMSQGVQSILGSLGNAVQQLLVQRLAQAASQSLATFGQWVLGVLSQVGSVIVAVIQQAYATLVAFFAWSGPIAPVLAGGVIAAALAGIGSIASQVLGSIRIPGLAQGGIVTGPTLAMVGEGHRREAVIPLERDNVIAESVGAAVFDAMMTAHRFQQASGPGPAGDDREVVLRIDGATFARLILPHLVREGQRQGMDVVIRPALGV